MYIMKRLLLAPFSPRTLYRIIQVMSNNSTREGKRLYEQNVTKYNTLNMVKPPLSKTSSIQVRSLSRAKHHVQKCQSARAWVLAMHLQMI